MIGLLLLETTAETQDADFRKIILEYVIYAAVIVIGLAILWMLKQKDKLPKHSDLKKSLEALGADLRSFRGAESQSGKSRYDFFKKISKLLYRTDKLIYVTDRMAQKERDGNIDNISDLLEGARNDLAPYKFGGKARDDMSGVSAAEEKLTKSVEVLDRILERDAYLKARHAKQ